MYTPSDMEQLNQKGISIKQLEEQIQFLQKGFPALTIVAPVSTQKGIRSIPISDHEEYIQEWETYLKSNKQVMKFVPASGAASRMFKDLYEFLSASYSIPTTTYEQLFFDQITYFPFFNALNECCLLNEHKSIEQLIIEKEYPTVVKYLLEEQGLHYGALPKGLLLFHTYPDEKRTPVDEHMVEGALYACDANRVVNLHFTVSSENREPFRQWIETKRTFYEQKYDVSYNISFSEQKPSTDTIAGDENNEPFRENGQMVFRPGGHGALIENLNEMDADVVFIKNIDNVVPDALKKTTIHYKKLLAGVLVRTQQQIFDYLTRIESGKYTHNQLIEMLYFLQNDLCIKNPETRILEDVELVLYIKSKLNRPLRVCGMVKNEGEPGGGPFLAVNLDGTLSPQIVESAQIDLNDPNKQAIFEQNDYFNPVDLVCAIKNAKGEKFDLLDHVDKNTGFISIKSKAGKKLKAIELPGLWNGAMSDWNTIFVEVPADTFHPVKTIYDLLRPEHQQK